MSKPSDDRCWISTSEAASMLFLTPGRVTQLLREGKLEGTRFGNKGAWRVLKSSVEGYRSQGSRDGAAQRPSESLASIDAWAQRDRVEDLLTSLKTELEGLLNHLPTVWDGFRHQASQRHQWKKVHGVPTLNWRLAIEQQDHWRIFYRGLQSHLPAVAAGLQTIKTSLSRYCMALIRWEDHYRNEASAAEDCRSGAVRLNDSHFFRSILNEIELEDSSLPTETQYTWAPTGEGTEVALLKVVLFWAKDDQVASSWIARHLQWRLGLDRRELNQFRSEARGAAGRVVEMIRDLQGRSIGT